MWGASINTFLICAEMGLLTSIELKSDCVYRLRVSFAFASGLLEAARDSISQPFAGLLSRNSEVPSRQKPNCYFSMQLR